MYTRKGILNEIGRLYEEIERCQDAILFARDERNAEKEGKALSQMEGIVIGVQQTLTVISDHLKAHPCWQDIKRIVNIADDPRLLSAAEASGWSEEEYYTKVLEESLKADE